MENKTNSQNNKTKIIIIAAVAAVLIILGIFAGLGVYAKGLDTSMPKLKLGDMEVGGLTRDQLMVRLEGKTAEDYGFKTIHVDFTAGEGFDITPEQAGVKDVNNRIADGVMSYGKDNIFGAAVIFIKCSISGGNISAGSVVGIDEQAVKSLASSHAQEVMSALNEGYKIEDDTLRITKGAKAVTINPDDIVKLIKDAYDKMSFESLTYEADESQAKEINLDEIYNSICAKMVNATYNKQTGEITESTVGIDFDLAAAKEKFNAASDGQVVEIKLTVEKPKTDSEILRTRLFADKLSSKSTTLSGSSSNRINNITLAAKAINGTVLNPGEEFSFNGIVGQRTKAKGYKEAGAYAGGESVSQVGGGICQVSSTIYYCTLMANLEITARDNHMFPVSYLPLGLDATVNWPNLDYKFKNSSNYPIKIVSYVSGKTLYVEFHGTNERTDGHYFELGYKTIGTTARPVEEKVDPSLAPGQTKVERSGHDGITVNAYRYEYDANGKLVNTEHINKSAYRTQSRIIRVGPAAQPKPDPQPDPTPDPDPSDPPSTDPGEMIDPDEIPQG